MQSFENRHALVTGGGTGIGLAVARALVQAGARVTVASRDLNRCKAATQGIGGVDALQLDVTDPDSVAAAFESAGPVDILVNNSGIALAAPFENTTLEQMNQVLAVNLTGVALCMQAVLPMMREKDAGRIVNIASTAGLKGYPYTSIYAASKHGVIGMTRSLALELVSTNITVNSVCPGFTDTGIVADAIANITAKTGRSEDEAFAELVKHNPQKRLISPEEVASAVLWLCRDDSSSINGQAIAVAGGEIM